MAPKPLLGSPPPPPPRARVEQRGAAGARAARCRGGGWAARTEAARLPRSVSSIVLACRDERGLRLASRRFGAAQAGARGPTGAELAGGGAVRRNALTSPCGVVSGRDDSGVGGDVSSQYAARDETRPVSTGKGGGGGGLFSGHGGTSSRSSTFFWPKKVAAATTCKGTPLRLCMSPEHRGCRFAGECLSFSTLADLQFPKHL